MRVRVAGIAAIALLGMMAVPFVGWAEPGVEVVRVVPTHPTVSMSAGAGSALAPGALVRVAVSGLPADLAAVACVSLRARPSGASGDGLPLFACTSGGCMPLLGFPACGAAGSYDRRTGAGSMSIPWNANQHLRGLYQLRAEVLLAYTDSMLGLWQRTDWVDVNLISGPPVSCLVTLNSPRAGALFEPGESITLTGRIQPAERLQGLVVRITHNAGAQQSTWVMPVRFSADGQFRFQWNTEGMPAGNYVLQAICTPQEGPEVRSQLVPVILRPDGAPACFTITANSVLIKDGDRIEVEAGEQIQFCLSVGPSDAPCQLGSLRWEFAPGRESTEKCPRYTYTAPGQYAVQLTVFRSPGLQGDVLLTRTFSVLVRPRRPVAVGTREVLGFPDPCAGTMTVLPGIPIYARVRVTSSAPVASLAIREVLPKGWTVSDETLQPEDELVPYTIQPMHRSAEAGEDGASGELRHAYTWLVLPRTGTIPAGTSIEIVYRLTPPMDSGFVAAGSVRGAAQPLQGMVKVRTAAEGDQGYPIGGEPRLSIVDRLFVSVAVAHLANGGIEAKRFGPEGEAPTYLISAEQLEWALLQLGSGEDERDEDIPFTGRRLTTEDAMDISFYFTQRLPVTECIR